MPYGLSDKTVEQINTVFSHYPTLHKVLLYGSRAKGTYKNGSDIDLTLVGDALDLPLLQKIETEIDDLLLPYKIDLSIYDDIQNQELKSHIDRVGVCFYTSDTALPDTEA